MMYQHYLRESAEENIIINTNLIEEWDIYLMLMMLKKT